LIRYTRLYALQRVARPNHRAPHMGRGIIKPETFLRLLEVSANHVFEIFDADHCVWVEGVWIVHGDQPARHVPFVPTCPLVGLAKIVRRPIVLSEVADIRLGISVPDGFVGEVAQRLMVTPQLTSSAT